jgi:hypothetical protein
VAAQPRATSPATAELGGAKPIADVDVPFPLHDDEEVYAYLRRHWFALYPKIAGYLLLAVVPPAILVALGVELDLFDGAGATVIGVIAAIWILFWLVRLFFTWYSYNNDIWVVTDQRLVDSIKKHPFSHTVASADLVNVVDTKVSVSGIFPSVLKYGDVDCETAGSSNRFCLGSIPQPAKVQALIDRLRDVARRESGRP